MQQGILYDLEDVMVEAVASGLFDSLCTIQQLDNTFGPSGAPVQSWATVSGLDNVPCMAPPVSEVRIQATEVKDLAEILASQLKHVLLDSYYPQIVSSMRAVIDGVAYDILGAESDSQRQMTRMEVRLATL